MRYFIILFFVSNVLNAQFAPTVGEIGTTAIHANSEIFVDWAKSCEVIRGYKNIMIPDSGFVTVGKDSSALQKADGIAVLSLGDGGMAILQFASPIQNGESWDFAVFENSFSDSFLEMAFVEVSSDGVNFVRFPASSLTPTDYQVGTWGAVETIKINNLAGKYQALYGTPFDLEELKNEVGLDVNKITHVKIIDVVGSMDNNFATLDKDGNKINDPFPTLFESGGFDLDAVGVIHNQANKTKEINSISWSVYPNPARDVINYSIASDILVTSIQIVDLLGKEQGLKLVTENTSKSISVLGLANGVYYLTLNTQNGKITQKIYVQGE